MGSVRNKPKPRNVDIPIKANKVRNSKHNRRGYGQRNKAKTTNFSILCNNANGIMSKKESFLNLIKNEKPSCFILQETKLQNTGKLKIEGYQVFELVRKNTDGGAGGLAIGIENELKECPALISEGDEEAEILVVEIKMGNLPTRIICAYGPQEGSPKSEVKMFYSRLDEEIASAQEADYGIILEMDCNAKLGKNIIKGDPAENMSENGKHLFELLEKHNLHLVNASDKCKGVITRQRINKKGTDQEKIEKSVIDFLVVNEVVTPFIIEMNIDDKREKVLTNFSSKNPSKQVKESDHNIIEAKFSFQVQRGRHSNRKEIYNVRNKECLAVFKEKTDTGDDFTKCFSDNGNIEEEGKKWFKVLKDKIHQSFRKIRIDKAKKNLRKSEIDIKIDERNKVKNELMNTNIALAQKQSLEMKINELNETISDLCGQKNAKIITDQVQNLSDTEGRFSRSNMWQIKKKLCPRILPLPIAKRDEKGMMITNQSLLKKLYTETYQFRLRSRTILPHLERLKYLREKLFYERLRKAEINKSNDWSMKELEKVLNSLKEGKSSDPRGLVNDLFRLENIGDDLKNSLMVLLSKIKNQLKQPQFVNEVDIISLFKGKGSKHLLSNERGIFILNLVRTLKDKLIYQDIYETVDSVMSDCQVGGRKKRSISNHIFVVNAILNSVKQKESDPIDLQIFDVEKCFDSLWLEQCCNDQWEAGIIDDKLALIYYGNQTNEVAINLPIGQTERINIPNIVMQGGPLGSLQCSLQTDKIGKKALQKNEHIYMYRNEIPVGPLTMVDDILSITKCGMESVMANAFINSQIEQNKLTLNTEKCHKIHAGGKKEMCPKLVAHQQEMKDKSKEKYLGDIISSDGSNTNNIKHKVNIGVGKISSIMNILKEVSLGRKFYFTIATILRESILLSSILLNSESWIGLTATNIDELEQVDEMLLRRILETPTTTPKPALYLELGCMPIRFVIMKRRLLFLHYLLNLKKDEMLSKVFWKMTKSSLKNDWILKAKENLKELGMDENNFDIIKVKKKKKFKKELRIAIKKRAFNYLIEKIKKDDMKKIKNIKYKNLEMQKYLKTGKIYTNRKKLLFKIRTKMLNVGKNYGRNVLCPICLKEEDNQIHLTKCIIILNSLTIQDSNINIDDAFETNMDKANAISIVIEKILQKREVILDSRKNT